MNTKACLSPFTLSLIALVLLCGLAASAQDQVTQQPATSAVPNANAKNATILPPYTTGYIAKYTSAFGTTGNAHMDERNAGRLDVYENISLTQTNYAYQINQQAVLSILGTQNLFVGVTGIINAGTQNTFVGANAGTSNTSGTQNTFVGANAGTSYTNGIHNTFVGEEAGYYKTTGDGNAFTGYRAGYRNDLGTHNAFFGNEAGHYNNGNNNAFVGSAAGFQYFTVPGAPPPSNDTFIGEEAGVNATGSSNTFVGYQSGFNTIIGDFNIYIGNKGIPVGNNESGIIRIGDVQTDTYIAGIYSSIATMVPGDLVVCIKPSGELYGAAYHTDCTSSSRRFKENILDMGDSSSKLLNLRPVTFFYKSQFDDGSHALQYGLIAEEVAKVYPEMAAYDKDGQPYAVRYQMLAPMLLNEFQKQHVVLATQQDEMTALREQTEAQQQQMLAQQQEIEGLKSQLQLQNAAFQDRLLRLESLVARQMQTAADKPAPATTPATGGLQ